MYGLYKSSTNLPPIYVLNVIVLVVAMMQQVRLQHFAYYKASLSIVEIERMFVKYAMNSKDDVVLYCG